MTTRVSGEPVSQLASRPAAVGIVMPLASQQGGAEALLQYLLRHAHQEHRLVCAFLEDGPLVSEARALGYDTTVFPITHLSHLTNYVKTLLALRSWIETKELDVVFSWMPKAHMYVSLAALFVKVRVGWFQHGVPYGHPIDRLIAVLPADAVVCCSETSKRGQEQMFPSRPSHVCYPGVPLSPVQTMSAEEARTQLGLSQGTPVIGMVARLEHWKGAHILVEAASEIFKRYPKATIFVLGGEHPLDMAYSERVHAMVKQLNRGQQFILVGHRPITEVPVWQAAADVIVHPVIGVEPFGMSVVEAMGVGRVVVASNVGGPAEAIEDGVSGILIAGGDPALLTHTVIQLIEDPDRRAAIEEKAYHRARHFSVDAFVARFNEVMTDLLT